MAHGKPFWGGGTHPYRAIGESGESFGRPLQRGLCALADGFQFRQRARASRRAATGHGALQLFDALPVRSPNITACSHCLIRMTSNPEDSSAVVDRLAQTIVERPVQTCAPHQTLLYSIETLKNYDTPGEGLAITPLEEKKLSDGGA